MSRIKRSSFLWALGALVASLLVCTETQATERPMRFLGETTAVFADTLQNATVDTTAAVATDGCDRLELCGAWAGADSVTIVIEGSLDATNWFELFTATNVSDAGNGAFDLYLNETLSSHKNNATTGAAAYEPGICARFVRVIIDNNDVHVDATKLTLTTFCTQ